ncbi:MAG: nucleotide triphosphate diphosphatase NUDT15 [Terriglobales bacterium]
MTHHAIWQKKFVPQLRLDVYFPRWHPMNRMGETRTYPKIGVNVLVFRGWNLLLGRRRTSDDRRMWCPPGGHLEWGESVFACAHREVLEETAVRISNLIRGPYTNDRSCPDNMHYVSLFVLADHESGSAENREPDVFDSWQWFDVECLPSPLFYNIANLIRLKSLRSLRNWHKAVLSESKYQNRNDLMVSNGIE